MFRWLYWKTNTEEDIYIFSMHALNVHFAILAYISKTEYSTTSHFNTFFRTFFFLFASDSLFVIAYWYIKVLRYYILVHLCNFSPHVFANEF